MNKFHVTSIVCDAIKKSTNRGELWCAILAELQPKSVCEVGVWKGEFAATLLSGVVSIDEYIFVDPWKSLPNWNKPANVSDAEFENIRNEAFERTKEFSEKLRELRLPTKEAAAYINDSSLDFVYIDGDHTLRGITIDLHFMAQKIKKNGFIGGDDFTRNIWQHDEQYDPTEVHPYAIYFAEANDLTIFTLPFNQFLIAKLGDPFDVVDLANYAVLTPKQIYSKPGI